jgi:hypothetical protein
MNKDLFGTAGLQPSGKYGTAEDNTLRNLIMLRVFWYSHPELKYMDFFEYICPRNFGDDLLAAVRPKVAHLFNNLTYQKFCETVYGLPFTPAMKEGKMEAFMTVDTCSFLKRKFVYREDLGRKVAPLEMDSIVKSLIWYVPSPNVTLEEQMVSTVTSALWEMSLHLDEKKFEIFRSKMQSEISHSFCCGREVKLPTFEGIMNVVLQV